ncbi:MAG: tetratricopeptide repeat protein, partial [Acidobacteriia bacterium]|nr:tetratricopeptide repeat protein [Terriglobia bacterium]
MNRVALDDQHRSPSPPAVWLAVALLLIPAVGWSAEQNPSRAVQQAAKLLQSGQVEQARVELHRVVGEHPEFYPAYSLLGVCYSQIGKLEEARPYFEKAVQLAPNSPQARNN